MQVNRALENADSICSALSVELKIKMCVSDVFRCDEVPFGGGARDGAELVMGHAPGMQIIEQPEKIKTQQREKEARQEELKQIRVQGNSDENPDPEEARDDGEEKEASGNPKDEAMI